MYSEPLIQRKHFLNFCQHTVPLYPLLIIIKGNEEISIEMQNQRKTFEF